MFQATKFVLKHNLKIKTNNLNCKTEIKYKM